MAVIHEKRGSKDIPHYFHSLKEKDGSEKTVYLGSDPYQARKNIVKLESARSAPSPKADELKHSLNKIANHQQSVEQRLSEVKKTYYAQKRYDELLAKDQHPERGLVAVVITLGFAALLFLFLLFFTPEVTGFAVLGSGVTIQDALTTPFAGFMITGALIVLLGVTIIHAKLHMRRRRLAKYQR